MDAFILRVLADVAAGRVYIDNNGDVSVEQSANVDPTDEPRYIAIVRELHRASLAEEDGRVEPGTQRRLRLTVPGGYESATALTYVDGVLRAVAR